MSHKHKSKYKISDWTKFKLFFWLFGFGFPFPLKVDQSIFKGSMEEIILRFSHLSEKIFNLLDNNGLEKSRKVDRYWNVYIAKQKFYSIRIIKTTVEQFQEVGPAWNTLFAKCTTKSITGLLKALQCFYLEQKMSQGLTNCTLVYSLNSPKGITPLHIAAYSGDLVLLKAIFERNQEYQKDGWGCTPLHYAAHNGHLEMCEYIMQTFENGNTRNNSGETPLHEAVYHGHSMTFKFLVKNSVDNNPADHSGWTPLHCAALHGHLEIFQFLMGIVKNKTPYTTTPMGLFPLHLAAQNPGIDFKPEGCKHLEICELILKESDDKNPRVNTDGVRYRKFLTLEALSLEYYYYD